jgi:UDP-N-acetylmuramyl pentapeptide phosphotransferase/UDP-N-acetylglucosamine-1-phosphate transferase
MIPVNQSMILAFLSALMISYVAIPPIVRVSKAKRLGALPNGRTSHVGVIPTLGGVAIFAAVSIGGSLFLNTDFPREFQYIIPAMVILFFFGLKDDLVGLTPQKKMAGQVIASLFVILAADVRIISLNGLFGINEIPYGISIVLSFVIFVGIINAYNLVDGIDGLASGLGIFVSSVLGIWLFHLGRPNYATFAFATAGGLIPFYFFNVFSKENKLFMGDTGSQLLGLLFATFAVKILWCPADSESMAFMRGEPAVVMAVLVIPIADTIRVMTLRIIKGKSPFFADRNHFHHGLLSLGMTHWQASTTVILTNLSIFVIAILLRNMPVLGLGIIVMGLGLISCTMPSLLLRYQIVDRKKVAGHEEHHHLTEESQPVRKKEDVSSLN